MHKALKQHVYIEYFLCHGRAPQPVTPSHREEDPRPATRLTGKGPPAGDHPHIIRCCPHFACV